MPPKIIFLRHAEAQHNVDPGAESWTRYKDSHLTPLGEKQAQTLRRTFIHKPDLIIVSPLRRTLHTALQGLARPDVPLIVDPELQEAGEWPCDIGSDVKILESDFRDAELDFSQVPSDWNSKSGVWAATSEAVQARARSVRRKLRQRPENLILVVTHGGFLTELVPDMVPYANAEWRVHAFLRGEQDEDALLSECDMGDDSAALGQGHNTLEPQKAAMDHGV